VAEPQLWWVGEMGKAEGLGALACVCALHAQLCVRGAREGLVGASKPLSWFLSSVFGLKRVGRWRTVKPSA